MASLCPASSCILALRDEDIGNLNSSDWRASQNESLVERRIDIKLDCNFTAKGPENPSCKLEVVAWKNGTTDLCGSCQFCNLLADSIQRRVELDPPLGWNLCWTPDVASFPRPFPSQIGSLHFQTLQYQQHRTSQAFRSLQTMNSEWNVSLLLLTGYLLLNPKDEVMGLVLKVEVDLAFELFGEENNPVVELLKIHRRPIHGPRLSGVNVSKIRDWIRECDENHDRCNVDSTQPDYNAAEGATAFLPARLIEVGDALDHPRLILTSDLEPRTPKSKAIDYIALSYCWGILDGTSKLLTTTHDTIRSRTESIEVGTMPLAFQDAVTVARMLCIQYLWIDSLCIIQDDARDWQTESSRMAEIFSNAYLTLIAATGSGCNDRFLSRGSPGPSCTVPLKTSAEPAVQGEFSLRFRQHRGPSDKMTEIRGSRWITRGWTFQEERLARRALIFGENKFFLDCRTLERSQDSDRHEPRPDWVVSVTGSLGEGSAPKPESTEIGKVWDNWQTLCAHYSHRELAFPEDKLPAFSGMANRFAKKVQSEYLAGIWRHNLMHDLFWEPLTTMTSPKKYRAPTWSWASLDGRIKWLPWTDLLYCTRCIMYCTVLDAQTVPAGLDRYGAVKDGFLKIRGVIKEMKVRWSGEKNMGKNLRYAWRLNHEGKAIGESNLDMEGNRVQIHGREKIYQALLVARCNGKTRTRGLLLEKNGRKREDHDEFERVGTFVLFSDVTIGEHWSEGIWNRDAEQVIMIV